MKAGVNGSNRASREHKFSPFARREKVSQGVARMVAKDVANRRLTPGTALPPEQEMADQYGVGRTTVREALRLLETQGLVVIRPGLGGGPVVGQPSPTDLGRTMTMFLQFAGTPYSHVLDAALNLEGMCAAAAARRCRVEGKEFFDRQMPADALELPGKGVDDATWIDLSSRFHQAVYQMMGNDVLSLVVQGIGVIFSDRAKFDEHQHWSTRDRRRVHGEHVEIGEAIRSGDADRARELTEVHFRKINTAIRRQYPRLADEAIDWR
jgi:GntR family transcriptional repressor for pyruvate dehydrogenase complex